MDSKDITLDQVCRNTVDNAMYHITHSMLVGRIVKKEIRKDEFAGFAVVLYPVVVAIVSSLQRFASQFNILKDTDLASLAFEQVVVEIRNLRGWQQMLKELKINHEAYNALLIDSPQRLHMHESVVELCSMIQHTCDVKQGDNIMYFIILWVLKYVFVKLACMLQGSINALCGSNRHGWGSVRFHEFTTWWRSQAGVLSVEYFSPPIRDKLKDNDDQVTSRLVLEHVNKTTTLLVDIFSTPKFASVDLTALRI